ncbi:hypothetical protein VTN00DRAFT_7240 [Thermoascus crustaceus]|uniref:uncharacterized protein n=1 Tax=Thermoascus crustaceus TaxID=5088 RepID=UPI0037432350
MDGWKAEQQIREEHLLGRITSLELEVGKLCTELTATTQQHPKSPLPAPPAQEHRPPSRAASKTTEYQAPKAPSVGIPKTTRQPVKLEASYADMAALMATRPGGQEWQVVSPKQKNKAQKSSTTRTPGEPNTSQKPEDLKPIKEKNKEACRLIFQRDSGVMAPKAEQEEVILALNRALAKKGFPYFLQGPPSDRSLSGRPSSGIGGAPRAMLQNPQKLKDSEKKGSTIVITGTIASGLMEIALYAALSVWVPIRELSMPVRGSHPAMARTCSKIQEAQKHLSKQRGPNKEPIGSPMGDHRSVQAIIPSSPDCAVVVASQQAPQQAPQQAMPQTPQQPKHSQPMLAPRTPITTLGNVNMGNTQTPLAGTGPRPIAGFS